jgi:lipoprotein-releasing system permease protein
MYKFILPLRYLLKRRITLLAVAAVALCVFVSLVVITVLSGLTSQFKLKMHNFVGDCVISSKSVLGFDGYQGFMESLRKQSFVAAVTPVIRTSALVKARSAMGETEDTPREILGIDPNTHSEVTGFGPSLYWHRADPSKAFVVSYDPTLPGCLSSIGILADRDEQGEYHLPSRTPVVSFEVTVLPLTSKGVPAKATTDMVNTKTYWLADAVNTGLARVDWSTIYLPFDQAQMLCGMNLGSPRATALFVKFRQGTTVEDGCRRVDELWHRYLLAQSSSSDLMSQVRVQPWQMYQREMVAAVETEQRMMSIIFAFLGFITVFIVFVIFYMIISHKSKDIGILKSLGVSSAGITGMFLFFGLMVGTIGAAIGTLSGWWFLTYINNIEAFLLRTIHFQLWNRRLYAINEIPNTIYSEVLIVIISCAILAAIIGALAPSLQAARKKPVQSLQVNQL